MKNFRLESQGPQSDQEALDAVVFHIIKQGKRCGTVDGFCYYRHPDDDSLSCAVGCLIPDTLVPEDLEDQGLDSIRSDILPKLSYGILMELQRAHDRTKRDWVESTIRKIKSVIAAKYPELKFPDI